MTPDQLAKSGTEHGEQRALFAWINVAKRHGFDVAWQYADSGDQRVFETSPYATVNVEQVPELHRIFAIPNGGLRDKITAAKLKHEGVKSGVPDIFFPLPCALYAGLFIEMKRSADKTKKRRAGVTSDTQDDWIEYLSSVRYAVSICYTWREAANDVQKYVQMVRQNR